MVPTGYMCTLTIMEGDKGLPQNREGKEEHCLMMVEARGEEHAPRYWPWKVFHLKTTIQSPAF